MAAVSMVSRTGSIVELATHVADGETVNSVRGYSAKCMDLALESSPEGVWCFLPVTLEKVLR